MISSRDESIASFDPSHTTAATTCSLSRENDQTLASSPPSTAIDSPVTKPAAGETRYSSAPPSSSGFTSLLYGRYLNQHLAELVVLVRRARFIVEPSGLDCIDADILTGPFQRQRPGQIQHRRLRSAVERRVRHSAFRKYRGHIHDHAPPPWRSITRDASWHDSRPSSDCSR